MTNINSEVLNAAIVATKSFVGADTKMRAESEKVGMAYVRAGIYSDWLQDKKDLRETLYVLKDNTTIQRKALFDLVKDTIAKKALSAKGYTLFTTDVKALSDAEKEERVALQRDVSKRMGNLRRSIATYESREEDEPKKRTADEMFIDVIVRATKLATRDDFTNDNKALIVERLNAIIKSL